MNCLPGISRLSFNRQSPQNVSTPTDAYQKKPPNTINPFKHGQIETISSPTRHLQSFDSLPGDFVRKTFSAQVPSESQWIELALRKAEPETPRMSTFQPVSEPADNCYPQIKPDTDKQQASEPHGHHWTASTYTKRLSPIPE
ncbi:hypothetical protein [Endozoicomonas sp. GU-1]|uniref:hypothetical protein n=1 Tax=Endozoicomonas sp. GU-1 TaxID=3009078 RepID=UPI0022B2B441|nr:hypothetical protein [Endozoicomonas sp. GU-1]WBA80213.1 hypothetical protein O2T12_17985 [Endozoicomonas sp. GU-1]WBA87789.1 hypothetical protein O3276_07210 [Endozoicomonas sp. GU-1]